MKSNAQQSHRPRSSRALFHETIAEKVTHSPWWGGQSLLRSAILGRGPCDMLSFPLSSRGKCPSGLRTARGMTKSNSVGSCMKGRKTPRRKWLVNFFSFTLVCTLIAFIDLVCETLVLTWFNGEFSAFSKGELSLAASIIHTVIWGLTIISGWERLRERPNK